jgi:hypothetical protein
MNNGLLISIVRLVKKALIIVIGLYLFLWICSLSLSWFINGALPPLQYWFPPKEAKLFQEKFENLPKETTQVVLSDLTPFEWTAVCQWGNYGHVKDEQTAQKVLGVSKKAIDELVYIDEGITTLLFKTKGKIVPIYLTFHDGNFSLTHQRNEEDCFVDRETMLNF